MSTTGPVKFGAPQQPSSAASRPSSAAMSGAGPSHAETAVPRGQKSNALLDKNRRKSVKLKMRQSAAYVDKVDEGGPDPHTPLLFRKGTSVGFLKKNDSGDGAPFVDYLDQHGTKDLATLAQLDSATIVAELRTRYLESIIYTHIGDILVAINPFRMIDNLYGQAAAELFATDSPACNVPHVFKIAQLAYKDVLASHNNQCCVISGESGSGKTETAKFIVSHLLSMCKGSGGLEQRIVQVNPLLEAFGNAKTIINDNSSRFGKYLDIKFGFFGNVLGAGLSEYLLEKSRVVSQGDGERNFHVFYYLFAGLAADQLAAFQLGDMTCYHYLRGGQLGLTREAVIDADIDAHREAFSNLTLCLSDVGFSPEDRNNVFSLLASILHLGNVDFVENDAGYSAVANDAMLEPVAELLGVDVADLSTSLVSTTTSIRGEVLTKNYSIDQAVDNRDAMGKGMYGRLFGWLVSQANVLLAPDNSPAYLEATSREGGVTEIGILDIFGFENFVSNSFEQLCINLANEQLQFYFNQHIFTWELASYAKEGIEVGSIGFRDNQTLLNMMLQKPLGIFALLDEESSLPRATPASWMAKLSSASKSCEWSGFNIVKAKSSKSVRLKSSNQSMKGTVGSAEQQGPFFQIDHFAGPVIYDASGFIEKNRDTQSQLVITLLKRASDPLVRALFKAGLGRTGTISSNNGRRQTKRSTKLSTSAVFKNSLLDLMGKMLKAKPHFIRCLKPNTKKLPDEWDTKHITQQLLYAGVVETTRIRRDGYSIRPDFAEFVEEYNSLGLSCFEIPSRDPEAPAPLAELKLACSKIIRAVGLRGAQLGTTKVFLKYYHGEKLRSELEHRNKMAIRIQTRVRQVLAVRQAARLREERRIRLEHEKKLAEQKRQEEEAAARAAAEAARAAALAAKIEEEERIRQEEAKKAATIKRMRIVKEEEKRRAEQAQELAAAQAAAEAARLEQEQLRQQAKEAEAAAAAEEAARAAAEEAERQALETRKRQEAEALKEAQEAHRAKAAAIAEAAEAGDPAAFDLPPDTPSGSAENAFAAVFNDEELDAEERDVLKELQAQRHAAEVRRKAKLRKEYERQQEAQRLERLAELDRLAEIQRKEDEEREAKAAVDREACEERMNDLDFSFSWGDPAPSASPVAAPAPVVPSPAPAITTAAATTPKATEGSRKTKKSRFGFFSRSNKKSPSPKPESGPGSEVMGNASQEQGGKKGKFSKKNKAKGAPPSPKTPIQPSAVESTLPSPLPSPNAADPANPATPITSSPAQEPSTDAQPTMSLRNKKKKKPPPTPSSSGPTSPVTRKEITPAPKQPALASASPATTPVATTPAATAPAATAPAVSPSAALPTKAQPTQPGQPRRRKLVRGGNKKETPVLPELIDAEKALADLDIFLDKYESHNQSLAGSSPEKVISGNVKRRSTLKRSSRAGGAQDSPVTLQKKRATQLEISGLTNMLLIGEKGSTGNLVGIPEPEPSTEVVERFVAGAKASVLGAARSQSCHDSKNVDVKGYVLAPEDLLNMRETERLAILSKVKEGSMTMDDAINELIEHKKRQNCVIC